MVQVRRGDPAILRVRARAMYYRRGPRRPGRPGRGGRSKLTDRSGELVTHAVERPADQPRDVHLRDPDLIGDLGLCEPVLEAHPQDLALSGREPLERRLEGGAVVGALELLVL